MRESEDEAGFKMHPTLEKNLTDYYEPTLIEKSLDLADNFGCFLFNTLYELAEKICPKLNDYVGKKGRGI